MIMHQSLETMSDFLWVPTYFLSISISTLSFIGNSQTCCQRPYFEKWYSNRQHCFHVFLPLPTKRNLKRSFKMWIRLCQPTAHKTTGGGQIRSFVYLPNAFLVCFEVAPDIEIFIKILSVFSCEIRRSNNFRPLFLCDRTQMEVDTCFMRRMPSSFDHIRHYLSCVFQLKANETKLVVKGIWLRHALWKHTDLSVNPHVVSS